MRPVGVKPAVTKIAHTAARRTDISGIGIPLPLFVVWVVARKV
jgi:hypothetical protein